ncbi:hypothetical protein [Hafnia paralvei]|uniref:hypothetical protein n=1 Tax=Hafnia paralvei TaxID=546367 RepID=UPI0029DA3252|nr:hypothetical protein [Hafnia paralvei]MDX6839778.1 hypothetical protein [Hafnia paralvei]
MTSREQFEAWLRAQPHVLNVGIEPDGTYTLHEDRVAWEAWQASREAVEVELPEEMKAREALDKGFMCDYAAGVTDTVVQVRENLIAAGIKVKGE